MSDEESFVILGTSPTPSMEAFSLTNFPKSEKESLSNNRNEVEELKEKSLPNGLSSIVDSNYSIVNHLNEKKSLNKSGENQTELLQNEMDQSKVGENQTELLQNEMDQSKVGENFSMLNLNQPKSANQSNLQSDRASEYSSIAANGTSTSQASSFGSMNKMKEENLAASFIIGDIHKDILKANVFSQFPSLCTGGTTGEDLVKLQSFMTEYGTLKESLAKTNLVMRQTFTVLQKWQSDTEVYKQEQADKIKNCEEKIARLLNENQELKKDLQMRQEIIHCQTQTMKEDNDALVMMVSEKSAIIANLRAKLQNHEEQQLDSYEVVKKGNKNDDDETETEYILMSEHKRIIKLMERKLSEITAQNLELKDMQTVYIDEINCLKVNLVSAEELLKKAQADINMLKRKDDDKSERFEDYEKSRNEMKQEIYLLKQQLDVYRNDFNLERDARANLAGEKEQILQDLKMLQRRNQQLIEETKLHVNQTSKFKTNPSTSHNDDYVSNKYSFVCPLCSSTFTTHEKLERHVLNCLDNGI